MRSRCADASAWRRTASSASRFEWMSASIAIRTPRPSATAIEATGSRQYIPGPSRCVEAAQRRPYNRPVKTQARTVSELGEFGLIERLREGLGDQAAGLARPGAPPPPPP